MTDVLAIYRTHDKRFGNPGQLGRERDPVLLQQTSISHQYLLPVNKRLQSVACQLEDLHVPPDGDLPGFSILPDRLGYRVIAPALDRGNCPHNLLFGKTLPDVYLLHLEHSLRQRPGLIEYNRVNLRDCIQVVSPFKENSLPGCRPDSPEIPQRDTDHQRARAGYYQKHERPVQPIIQHEREVRLYPRHDPRNQHDQHGQPRDHGRVDPGKLPDKKFRGSFTLGGVLYHFQNPGQSTLIIGFRDLHPHNPVGHDHPRQHILSRTDVPRHALPGQSRHVKSRHVTLHDPVQGYPFPHLDLDDLPDTNLFRFLDLFLPVTNNRRLLRTYIK